jgi:hypothetical protein
MPRNQLAPIYEGLRGTSCSDVHYRSVLRLSMDEKQQIASQIQNKLAAKGVRVGDKLGSAPNQAKITQIVRELKIEQQFQTELTRASRAGEPIEDVNLAIRKLVLSVHQQSGKRQRNSRNRKTGLQANNTQALSAASTSTQPPLAPTPALPLTPALTSTPAPTSNALLESRPPPRKPRLRLVSFRIDRDMATDTFRLNDFASSEHEAPPTKFHFRVLKAKMEAKVAPQQLDWSDLMIPLGNQFVKCLNREDFDMICEVTESWNQDLSLEGLRRVTPGGAVESPFHGEDREASRPRRTDGSVFSLWIDARPGHEDRVLNGRIMY